MASNDRARLGSFALWPFAVLTLVGAVYLRDLGVLGPRERGSQSAPGLAAAGGGEPAAARAPLPSGVSFSLLGAGGAAKPLSSAPAAVLSGAPHSVSFAFCTS